MSYWTADCSSFVYTEVWPDFTDARGKFVAISGCLMSEVTLIWDSHTRIVTLINSGHAPDTKSAENVSKNRQLKSNLQANLVFYSRNDRREESKYRGHFRASHLVFPRE